MDDLISRKAAIDAFLTELTKRERKNLLHTWSTVEVKYFVVDMLEKSPSSQPERKKGKWIIKDDTERFIAQCNCCRYIEDSRRIKNFCPNCGADMRGEQDDESRSTSNAQTDTRARGMGATDKSSGI